MEKILYSVDEAKALLDAGKAVLVDIRDAETYGKDHIPGAVNVPDVFFYLSETSPAGLKALHDTFASQFGAVGLDGDKVAIVYEDALNTRYGGSCRGWFLLKYMGYPRAGVLDGGMSAWRLAGLPVTDEVPAPVPSVFPLNPQPGMLATKQDMLAAIYDPRVVKLDNRDKVEWLGESSSPYGKDFVPRKGRIPGATWLEWYELMDDSLPVPGFKSPEAIRALTASRGIKPDDDIIIYCFKGARASNTFLALTLAGFSKLRIYFGSWNEWARDSSLPIETGLPTRSSVPLAMPEALAASA